MALTPQQIKEAREKIGLNSDNPTQVTGVNLLSRIQGKDNSETFIDRLKQGYQTGAEKITTAVKSGSDVLNNKDANILEKTKGLLETGLNTAGAVAGAAFTPITAAIEPIVSPVIQKISSIPGVEDKVQQLSDWAKNHPEAANNLQSVFDLATLGVGGASEQLAKDVAIKTGNEIVKAGKQVGKSTGNAINAVKKATGEVIPSTERIVNTQVTKALDLTAGDVKNINLSTGNEVGQFLAEKNLIMGNKDETVKAIQDFYDTSYKQVRNEIAKVDKNYSPYNVPRYTEALKAIKKQVSDVPGLQKVSVEVENLLNKSKNEISLNDVQRVKELLDEHFNLYKVTGDVKEGVAKEGLANLRSDIKSFIEKEVKNTTGEDIATLNNDVSTSRSTLNAIEERSTRGLTSSNIKIGDLGTFGVGSMFGGPATGVALLVTKKIAESSAIRLKVAKWLDGISDARKLKIKESLQQGEVPKDLLKIVEPQSTLKPKASIKNTNTQKGSISPKSTTNTKKVNNIKSKKK